MKKIKLCLTIILLLSFVKLTYAQVDRTRQPKSGPIPTIDLLKPKTFKLKNGLTVLVVEDKKLPTFSVRITIDNPPTLEGKKSGLNALSNALFGEGSSNIKKEIFNEEVDYLGASISMGMSFAFANGLSKHQDRIFELLSEAALSPYFTEKELNKEKNKLITTIKGNQNNPSAIAQRAVRALTYGTNHPYGEFQTEKSIENITIDDIYLNYKKMFRPNNAYMVISGDIDFKEVRILVKKYFSKWKSSKKELASNINNPKDVLKTEINFIDIPDAVQSELSIINTTNLKTNSEDHHAALVTNFILGGSFNSYLNSNLREKNAWTYGARSSLGRNKWTKATFRASTSVRNSVTDSAIVETLAEINRIKNELVSDEMLDAAKATYLGNFIMSTENKSLLADFAINIKTQDLPENFYETFISKIDAVTKEDVKRIANKYFKSDNLRIVVVGKGSDIVNSLENINYNGNLIKVKYYDKFGKQIEKPLFTKEIDKNITVKFIYNNHLNAIGGIENLNKVKSISITALVTIPGAPFKPTATIKQKAPNKTSMEMSVPSMGTTLMTQKFNGKEGYIEQMGQKMIYDEEQNNNQMKKLGLFEEAYLDANSSEIISLSTINGNDIYKIKVDENSFRFYDAATGLLTMTEETTKAMGNEIKTITKFSDYRDVDGLNFAFKREILTGPQSIIFDIQEININEEISDDFFN